MPTKPTPKASARPAKRGVSAPLGQLCPCGLEPATVEVRVGPVYTKLGVHCFNSGIHVARLMLKLLK